MVLIWNFFLRISAELYELVYKRSIAKRILCAFCFQPFLKIETEMGNDMTPWLHYQGCTQHATANQTDNIVSLATAPVAKLLKRSNAFDICTKLRTKRVVTACVQARVPTLRPGTEFHRVGQVLQATVHLVLEGGTGATCQR